MHQKHQQILADITAAPALFILIAEYEKTLQRI